MPGTSQFPVALDDFPEIDANTSEGGVGVEHDVVHANVHAAILALQSKVGINGSADAGSLDKRLAAVEAGGAASGSVTLLGTAVVIGTAATALTLSGLSLSAYKSFRLSMKFNNATAAAANLSLYFNGDTTAANYSRQSVTFSNVTTSPSRGSDAVFDALPASETMTGIMDMRVDGDGRMRSVIYAGNRDAAAAIVLRFYAGVWVTVAPVTSMTIASSVASALSVGDSFSLWGIK